MIELENSNIPLCSSPNRPMLQINGPSKLNVSPIVPKKSNIRKSTRSNAGVPPSRYGQTEPKLKKQKVKKENSK